MEKIRYIYKALCRYAGLKDTDYYSREVVTNAYTLLQLIYILFRKREAFELESKMYTLIIHYLH